MVNPIQFKRITTTPTDEIGFIKAVNTIMVIIPLIGIFDPTTTAKTFAPTCTLRATLTIPRSTAFIYLLKIKPSVTTLTVPNLQTVKTIITVGIPIVVTNVVIFSPLLTVGTDHVVTVPGTFRTVVVNDNIVLIEYFVTVITDLQATPIKTIRTVVLACITTKIRSIEPDLTGITCLKVLAVGTTRTIVLTVVVDQVGFTGTIVTLHIRTP